jgi:hypothetical protein
VFIYEQPATGDVFTITDPQLRLDQLEEVQRAVATLLEHGLDAPAPVVEAVVEAAIAVPPDEAVVEVKAR